MKTSYELKEILEECYYYMFLRSTPSCNYWTIKWAKEKKADWFLSYSISEVEYNIIITRVSDMYGLNDEERESIRKASLLGCSPKFKEEE